MITVNINSVDCSDQIAWENFRCEQNLTSQVDTAKFKYRKYGGKTYAPEIGDEVEIYDGSDKIFDGKIQKINEGVETSEGIIYDIEALDWTDILMNTLVSETYENKTIAEIIADLCATYNSDFDANNVESDYSISKIVFNNISFYDAIKKLADIVQYEFYADVDKSIHFFPKFSKTAPFDLTDSNGNLIYKSLGREIDGKQLVNSVRVRGGEKDGEAYTDVITVKGNDSKSFKLPYKFANLTIRVDVGAGYVSKNVGIDNIDDFTTDDVLYNYQEKTFRFENALADGNKIEFSGNPKVPILAIASDSESIAEYGKREKLIKDASIEDLGIARKRAQAELLTYKEPVSEAKFTTYESGLRTGMVINLTSVIRGINVDYIIRKIVFKAIDPDTFGYDVELVTTRKYGLIELLQKLMKPEDKTTDDTEVTEKIQVDIQSLSITELIEVVAAHLDHQTVSISVNIQKDPLGAGVEPTWVLSPYFPTTISDTKRAGKLDVSFKVY